MRCVVVQLGLWSHSDCSVGCATVAAVGPTGILVSRILLQRGIGALVHCVALLAGQPMGIVGPTLLRLHFA